jgi:hypothetical protein
VQVDTCEPERRRDQRRGRAAVGTEPLAVQEELRVELPWPPSCQDLLHGLLVHAEQAGYGRQIRGERYDRADVQVTVGPAVQALADAGGKGIVHPGVTEGAGEPERLETTVLLDGSLETNDGVELEEGDGGRRIIEVHLARLDVCPELLRKGLGVDFEADCERRLR